MEEAQLIGYAVLAVITLGSFVTAVNKFKQPITDLTLVFTNSINDLKLIIQELKDCVTSLKESNDLLNKRLNKHGEEIDKLASRVQKLETKMSMYHKEG